MPNILLLEDNADMLTMLSQVLEFGGYHVLTGRNGKEGIEWLSQADFLPQMIISDLYMPGMDGTALLEQVRRHPDWSRIPFVMMSASNSETERQAILDSGAHGFLTKPFSLDDFNAILDSWGLAADT